ncbi:MAG: pyridoxal phosphate-dependent aminotransferase [Terracidiphilus sp.]
MHFSQRTSWNTEETDLARAYRLRRAAGLPIADLTASNPTRCGFAYPRALLDALSDPRALDYDPQPRGLLPAREAVCHYYAGHGVTVDPSQIILTTSTSEAYSFLFRLLCDSGDEIVVLQPGYPLFDFLAGLDDVQLKFAPFVYDHGWQIDFNGLRKALSPRTRAIVLVHPNNPTGHFTKEWEAAELATICREANLSLIVDEVFLDYAAVNKPGAPGPGSLRTGPRPRGGDPSSLGTGDSAGSAQPGAPRPSHLGTWDTTGPASPSSFAAGITGIPVFTVSGLSKIAGLSQMKAGWIVATGPELEAALDRLEVIADTFLSMNAPVQWALSAWLASAPEIQNQINQRVAANLAELDRLLRTVPAVDRLLFEGGWYAVLRIPAVEADERTVLNLLEQGAWVHPGYFFSLPDSGWLVVSLLAPGLEFSHGAGIMIDYFRKHQRSNTDGGGV